MKAKNVVWGISGAVLVAVVISTAAVGVSAQRAYADLDHGEPYSVSAAAPVLDTVSAQAPIDVPAVQASLDEAAALPGMGNLHGIVVDTTDGTTIWEHLATQPTTPASATKVLTAAAAVLTLDLDETLTTDVVAGATPGTVILRGEGDVWLDGEDIEELAGQLSGVEEVLVDTSAWSGPPMADGWEDQDIDGGYIAPMQPIMLAGGRGVDGVGDVPRSHTPALDVAAELAGHFGAEFGEGQAPPQSQVLASVESDPLLIRVQDMVKHSDNVAAEAIGREIAVQRGYPATFEGATQAILEALNEAGLNTSGTTIHDASGLSRDNLIPPRVLNDIMLQALEGEQLRPLVTTLPVGAGEGTLEQRYYELSGRGWVRAKTGTLTGTNALVGTVTGQSGRVYSFALLATDSEFESGRRALDVFASVLRDA